MLIRRARSLFKNKKGLTLVELLIVIAVSAIILVMMMGVMSYGVQLYNRIRRTANAINLSNDLMSGINDMVSYAYMATISGESETSADSPSWKNWQGVNEHLDTMIMCVSYRASTDYRGKLVYQKSYKDGTNTRYTKLYAVPSKYYGGLYVTNLAFERSLNRSMLVRDENGLEVNDEDTGAFYSLLKVSFDVITQAVIEDTDNGYDGHMKLYHAERTFCLENLFSNYNIVNEYTTVNDAGTFETLYELLNITTIDVYDGVWLQNYVTLLYTNKRTESLY